LKQTAVPVTGGELGPEPGGSRVDWDRRFLYECLIRWGGGSVVPSTGMAGWHETAATATRGASRLLSRAPAGRSSRLNRRLRDVAQVRRVRVPPGTQVLYGNITFPLSRPRLPVVWSTQGILDDRPGMWFPRRSAETHRRFIDASALTQCWSNKGRAGLQEWLGEEHMAKVEVVPPLVYVDLPAPWSRTAGDITAVFVGAYGWLKNLPAALEAMRHVDPGLALEVITADPPPPDLPSNVHWLGPRPRPEVLARLRSADVHLFPSSTESFGMAGIEAMAAGVAQIVHRGGVPAECAAGTALEVDGSDPEQVAAALIRLAGDDDLRSTLATRGHRRWVDHFSPEAVGPRLAELIDRAADAGRSDGRRIP